MCRPLVERKADKTGGNVPTEVRGDEITKALPSRGERRNEKFELVKSRENTMTDVAEATTLTGNQSAVERYCQRFAPASGRTLDPSVMRLMLFLTSPHRLLW